jgi:hypothetical protein
MAEKDKIYSSKIKQTNVFDFKETYRFVYDWLVDNGYSVTEESYSEKVGAGGKEIEISWSAKRKISDYFRFIISIDWRILGMTDTEVQKQGKKVKMNKGQIEIKVSGTLEKDYEDRWENNPLFKFLRGVYDRYIIKSRVESYEDKLSGDAEELIAQIKSWLALEGKR